MTKAITGQILERELFCVDEGNGYTKITTDESGKLIYRSKIKPGHVFRNDKLYNVTYNGKNVTVGTESGETRMNSDKFLVNPEFHDTLMFTGIAELDKENPRKQLDIFLMSGLPVGFYSKFGKQYTERLANLKPQTIVVNGVEKVIKIKDVDICPQSAIVFKDMKANRGKKILVIDYGTGTVDVSLWKDNRHVDSDSLPGACYDMYTDLASELRQYDYSPEEIEEFIREGKNRAKLGNEYIDISSNIDDVVASNISNHMTLIDKRFKPLTCDQIYVIGGGAALVSKYYEKKYNNCAIELDQYINSDIYYELGKIRFYRNIGL